MWFMQVLFDFTMFFHLPRDFQNNCIFVMHLRLKLEKFWISSEVWSRPACSNILQYNIIYIYIHMQVISYVFLCLLYIIYTYSYIYTHYIYICMYTDVYTSSNGVGIKLKRDEKGLAALAQVSGNFKCWHLWSSLFGPRSGVTALNFLVSKAKLEVRHAMMQWCTLTQAI